VLLAADPDRSRLAIYPPAALDSALAPAPTRQAVSPHESAVRSQRRRPRRHHSRRGPAARSTTRSTRGGCDRRYCPQAADRAAIGVASTSGTWCPLVMLTTRALARSRALTWSMGRSLTGHPGTGGPCPVDHGTGPGAVPTRPLMMPPPLPGVSGHSRVSQLLGHGDHEAPHRLEVFDRG
jgi:hypothetical protein